MESPPRRPNSLRYTGFDYSQPAGVFVTFCTHNRQRLFGTVTDNGVDLSPIGKMALERWMQIPMRQPGVQVDEFIIMPDHIHGILWMGSDIFQESAFCGEVIRWMKISVQRDVSIAATNGGVRYEEKLWQRGFHDRIIRNDEELDRIRFYIRTNPDRWRNR